MIYPRLGALGNHGRYGESSRCDIRFNRFVVLPTVFDSDHLLRYFLQHGAVVVAIVVVFVGASPPVQGMKVFEVCCSHDYRAELSA